MPLSPPGITDTPTRLNAVPTYQLITRPEQLAPLYAALQSTNNKFRRILCPDVYQSLTKVIPGVISKQITAQDAAAEVQDAFDKNCGKWVK